MLSHLQCRIESNYLASCRVQQLIPVCHRRGIYSSARDSPLTFKPSIIQQHRRAVASRSADEVAALAAEAQREALARERGALLRLSDDAIRGRLLKHGFSDQALPGDREGLLDLLAGAVLKARSHVVSYPLRKTPRSPRASKSFLVAPIDVEEVGFVNFLLDSGSSGALITAELREGLGLSPTDGQVVKGVDSSGLTLRQKVRLPPLRLGPQLLDIREAHVTSLKSDHDIDVGGVLGLSFLRMFELEICQDRQRMAFHPPGHIEQGLLDVEGMARLDCDVLKGGLLGVPASLNGSPRFPAILDLGANMSIVNKSAAMLAGWRGDADVDGGSRSGGSGAQKPFQTATADTQRGDLFLRGFLDVELGNVASPYVPGRALALLIRDVPSLSALGFGDSPLMVLGYDLLSADRLVLDLRNLRIFVSRA